MKRKIFFGALAGAAVLLLVAATTTEINVANLPLATSLSPTNLVLVLTNATKARLATAQQILNVPGYKVWTNASGVLSPVGFADQAQLSLSDTNNVRLSLISGDVNGAYSHVFSTANYLTSEYQALNTDGTNEYLATLSASLDDSFSQLQLRKTIGANVTSAIQLDAKDAPSVLIYDTNGIVFSVVTNGTITLQGQTNRIGDDGSQITFNGAAVGGGGQVWTNSASVLYPAAFPSKVVFDATNDNYKIGYENQFAETTDQFVIGYLNTLTNSNREHFIVGDNNSIGAGQGVGFIFGADNQIAAGASSTHTILGHFNHEESGGQSSILAGEINTNRSSSSGIFGRNNLITATSDYSYLVGENNGMGSTGNNHAYTVGHDNLIDEADTFGLGGYLHQSKTHHVLIGVSTDVNNPLTSQNHNSVELGIGAMPQLSVRADAVYVMGNGTDTASITTNGLVSAAAGFASTDTTAAVSIAATGWTNTFGKNAVVYFDGVAVTAKVYNNAGTAIYTNATALGGGSILLQPSGKVILSGTSVVGRAAPF